MNTATTSPHAPMHKSIATLPPHAPSAQVMTSSYNPYNFNSEGMSKGAGDAGAHHYKVDPTMLLPPWLAGWLPASLPACQAACLPACLLGSSPYM